MRTMRYRLMVPSVLLLLAGFVHADPLRVTVSTTLIEGIASAVGGERVALVPIIPYAMCPGHFDLPPRKAAEIASSALFLQHGFEAFARGLTFADGSPRRVVLKVEGNGMIPAVHRELATAVAEALCDAAPGDAAYFRTNSAAYLERVTAAETATLPDRAALDGTPVLAAVMIAPFAQWTGCRVEGTFPRDEALSARVFGELIRNGRKAGVRLIVENQQSMGRTGKRLASELGVPLVVLSNFPALENDGYPGALRAALKDLAAVAGQTRHGDVR